MLALLAHHHAAYAPIREIHDKMYLVNAIYKCFLPPAAAGRRKGWGQFAKSRRNSLDRDVPHVAPGAEPLDPTQNTFYETVIFLWRRVQHAIT